MASTELNRFDVFQGAHIQIAQIARGFRAPNISTGGGPKVHVVVADKVIDQLNLRMYLCVKA